MDDKSKNDFELSSKISNDKSERPLDKNDDDDIKNISNDQKRKIIFFDLSNINLTNEQRKFSIEINKRSFENNFYINNIDQSISYVIPYKNICPITMFLFLGIPFIISLFSNKKYVEYRGKPCQFSEADFYLIIDGYGNYHICKYEKKYFDVHSNFYVLKRFKKNISTLFSNI